MPRKFKITEREKRMLTLAAAGESYKSIGDELGLSRNSIANTLATIRDRWQCPNVTNCVVVALANGIIELEPFKMN